MSELSLVAVLTGHQEGDASYWGRPVCSCHWEEPAIGHDSKRGHAAWVAHIAAIMQSAELGVFTNCPYGSEPPFRPLADIGGGQQQ
jgi:hypothetical protein